MALFSYIISGGMVFVWYVIWLIIAANDPITDKWIAEKERHYFKSISSTSTSRKVIQMISFLI